MQRDAINRACQLIEEMGAGEVVGGMVDVYSKKKNLYVYHLMPTRSMHFSEQTSRKKI